MDASFFSPLFGDTIIRSQLWQWPTALHLSWSAAKYGQRAALGMFTHRRSQQQEHCLPHRLPGTQPESRC